MEVNRTGVHASHCCVKHGCKYGDDASCPVVKGEVAQKYDCEWCGEDERERLEQKDAYIAEYLMDLQPDTLRFLVADLEFNTRKLTTDNAALTAENARIFAMVDAREQTIAELTALCDEYRGERDAAKAETERLLNQNRKVWAILNGAGFGMYTDEEVNEQLRHYADVDARIDGMVSALTRARAGYEEFEKAKAHISGDRLGSYTLYGQWTLTADLTVEEIENHHYRTALERGRAEGLEEAAKIADEFEEDSRSRLKSGQAATAYLIAVAIRARAAKGEQ